MGDGFFNLFLQVSVGSYIVHTINFIDTECNGDTKHFHFIENENCTQQLAFIMVKSPVSNSLLKSQFDILFANSPWLITGQLLLSTTIVFWLNNQINAYKLFIWYGLTFIPPIYRGYLSFKYNSPNDLPLHFWKFRYLIGSFSYGMIWGSLVFFELPLTSFYFILFILSGYIVVTVNASSTYLPAVTYFVLPVGVLVSIRCFMLELSAPNEGWSFTLLIVVFSIFVVLLTAKVLNRSIVAGLKARFENIELVNSLKKQQVKLETAKIAAEKANQDKSRFLAAASHDLRQPLHAMSLFLDAIQHCDEKQEKLSLYGKLEQSVESLEELLNALLDISKIDARAINIQPTTFYASEICQKVANEFELEARSKGILIACRKSTIKVYSDPLWFERIIRNLVSNSVRYTESGKVLLTTRKKGDKCLVQIWDTGRGIAKEKQEIIFQEFIQLHTPKQGKNNGLGLGLAIVKRLANLLNHNVEVSSCLHRGTVFSISLPMSYLPVKTLETAEHLNIGDNLRNKHILILEDDPNVRSAMSVMLTNWGCIVFEADSASTFFSILEKHHDTLSLVISDYRLNDSSTGLDVLKQMRSRYELNIPAILITGETDTNVIRIINNSDYKVLHKPVRPAKLRISLNRILSQSNNLVSQA